jgi:uroporphyrin-III C-methyltransferase
VTSALGAAAAAQIPLTHRNASSALVLITAHQAANSDESDWSKLVGSGATVVIYMPGQHYAQIADKLKAAGLSGDTPCAIISRATAPDQRTVLASIDQLQLSPRLSAPTLLVIGEVVRFAVDGEIPISPEVISALHTDSVSEEPVA